MEEDEDEEGGSGGVVRKKNSLCHTHTHTHSAHMSQWLTDESFKSFYLTDCPVMLINNKTKTEMMLLEAVHNVKM